MIEVITELNMEERGREVRVLNRLVEADTKGERGEGRRELA